jgi:hypothetical protein
MKLKALALVLSLILFGCGDSSFQGQAFVDVAGASQRISNMDIKLIPISSIDNNKEKFKSNVDEILSKLTSDKSNSNKRKSLHEQLKKIADVLLDNESILKPIDGNLLKSAMSMLEELQNSIKSKDATLQKNFESLKLAKNPNIYILDKYADEYLATKTDADGRFKLKVNTKDVSLIVANKDNILWCLTLPEKTDIPLNLTLSNNFESECKECFFGSEKSKGIIGEISNYAVKKLESVNVSESATFEDKQMEKLAASVSALSKKHHQILKTIGRLPIDKALSQGLGDTISGISMRADIRREEINLEISIIEAREKHSTLVKEFIDKITELKLEKTS